jgi:alpha-ribazole phosphatase
MVNYKLHLIRHGTTTSNLEGRYAGRCDVELCAEGIKELKEYRQRFGYPQADEVYSSTLLRCRQTADMLYPDIPMTVVHELAEVSMGEFEGRLIKDLMNDPAYRLWLKDSLNNTPPGALETGGQFARRIADALHEVFADMTKRNVKSAAVVTHGGVIMGLMSAFALPRLPLYRWAVGNGMGYTILMDTHHWMRQNSFEVAGSIPPGLEVGGDERVMRSMGLDDKLF